MPGIVLGGINLVRNGTELNYNMILSATGTGTGVSTLTLTVIANITLELTGTARFYSDTAGTLNESTTKEVTTGAARTIYLKCPSGTAYLKFSLKNKISAIAWASSTNASNLMADVTTLTELTSLSILGTNTFTGSITNLTKLTYLDVISNTTLSGSITNLTGLILLRVNGTTTITGSVSGLVNLLSLIAGGTNTIYGNVSTLTKCAYINVVGNNNLEFTTVAALTGLCYLYVHSSVTLSESSINQILADFWTNRNAAKSRAERVIDLRGSAYSDWPTGQGLTDKANLAAYRSPTPPGTAALWTITTRSLPIAVFEGDSITAGVASVIPAYKFTTYYSGLDTLTEANRGVGNKTMLSYPTPDGTSMWENRNSIPTKPVHGKYLFFEFGANDCNYMRTETARFYTQYCEVIDAAIAKGWSAGNIKLLTCFSSGIPEYVNFNTQIAAVGVAKGVQVIDTGNNLYNGGTYAAFMADTVHPNDTGHLRMASFIDANITEP